MGKRSKKKKIPEQAMEFFRSEGRRGGKKSGKARMAKLTPEKRSEVARKAAAARWSKKKSAGAVDAPTKPEANSASASNPRIP